jgi:hypothetical protein
MAVRHADQDDHAVGGGALDAGESAGGQPVARGYPDVVNEGLT